MWPIQHSKSASISLKFGPHICDYQRARIARFVQDWSMVRLLTAIFGSRSLFFFFYACLSIFAKYQSLFSTDTVGPITVPRGVRETSVVLTRGPVPELLLVATRRTALGADSMAVNANDFQPNTIAFLQVPSIFTSHSTNNLLLFVFRPLSTGNSSHLNLTNPIFPKSRIHCSSFNSSPRQL